MPDPLRDRVVTALGDAYELTAEVGRGGMGVVYRARDRKLRRDVAIKVLPPELAFRDDVRTRFLREAETAAQLSHPNIVPIFSVDEKAGVVWFVMGFVDGESLAARLKREPRPPIADVRKILIGVADALAYAHHHGIVHRDIKPDNILIDRSSGRPMVTDFGIARAAEGDARLTVTGVAVGTPAYMSPEQATGEREIDGRSDEYSLAVVGYQMLAGELPFQATNTPSMLMKHISEPLRPLHLLPLDIPPDLSATIERALSKSPRDRWPDCMAFRDAIVSMKAPTGPAASSVSVAPSDARVSGSWKVPAARPTSRRDAPNRASSLSGQIAEDIQRRVVDHVRQRTRDAIEAANPGWQAYDPHPRDAESAANMPPIPAWMPDNWREARRQWRNERRAARAQSRQLRSGVLHPFEQTQDDRIRNFRGRIGRAVGSVLVFAGINAVFGPWTVPWFLIPSAFIALSVFRRGASLWAEGLRFHDIFGAEAREKLRRSAQMPRLAGPSPPADDALRLAPADVLGSRYGAIVRRAADDRAAALRALEKMGPADKAMIPDVAPSINSLAERVGNLAVGLCRLEEDVTPDALASIEKRLEEAKTQPESADREKKVALLERQRSTIADLMKRRDVLTAQIESTSLLLQNMRFDLLALNSAGVQSAIGDSMSATQEARALSRDIQIALEAAKDVR